VSDFTKLATEALERAEKAKHLSPHDEWVMVKQKSFDFLLTAREDVPALAHAVLELVGALQKVAEVQPGVLAMLRREEFVFDTPLDKPDVDRTLAERWEKLAFTLYSDICEANSIARQALKEDQ
jgi:hypothetical protein